VIEQSRHEFENLSCPSFLSYKFAHGLVSPSDRVFYVYTGSTHTFTRKITEMIWDGATVTFVAMQIAYYMGFKRVFLIGVDHNFKASGDPSEKQFLSGEDQNHFDPNYFGNREWQLPNLEASELAYQLARYFFNKEGRGIYDATDNGKLQVFPKMRYEEVLDRAKKKS